MQAHLGANRFTLACYNESILRPLFSAPQKNPKRAHAFPRSGLGSSANSQMDAAKLNPKIDVPADALKILAELSQEINASLNLDEVLPSAAALIKRLVDYEIFAVLLPDEGTDQMYFRFAIGHRAEVVNHWRIPMGEGIIGAAAATGQAIRVGDVRSDPRYLNALDGVRSELAVPLIVRGRVIGVLDIESNELDYFTPYQQVILTLVASRIGTAIENAKLYEHERSQSETLLLLNEVGREANSSLSVEEVLRRAAELTKRLINYQIFSILLYDEADNVFRHRVTVKFGQRVQEKFAVPAHEGIVGAAASLKRAVVVPDVTLDPRTTCERFRFSPRISRSPSKTRASTNSSPATRRAWSATSALPAAFKVLCCHACRARNSASKSPLA
jgi:sigma-B regulation protein RsbU (phosphoserine phosphatase)